MRKEDIKVGETYRVVEGDKFTLDYFSEGDEIKVEQISIGDYCIYCARLSDNFKQWLHHSQLEPIEKEGRFPFKLQEQDAKRVINVACEDWKSELSKNWGSPILYKGYVRISEAYYKKMREDCTEKQHIVFDEIFGYDKPEKEYPPKGTVCWCWDDSDAYKTLRLSLGDGEFTVADTLYNKGVGSKYDNFEIYEP